MPQARFICCLTFVLLLVLSVFSFAEEAPDARLDKQVTIELGNVTLAELTEELSKQIDVAITAGRTKSDWQVRERKTVVFAKDIPARELLERVLRLHHYRLGKTGDEGKWSYFIWQDRNEKAEEDALRAVESDSMKTAVGGMVDYYSSLAGDSGMSASELAELEKTDPTKHFFLTDPWGKAMCEFFANLPKDQWQKDESWAMQLDKSGSGLRQAAERFGREDMLLRQQDDLRGRNSDLAENLNDRESWLNKAPTGLSFMPLYGPNSPTKGNLRDELGILGFTWRDGEQQHVESVLLLTPRRGKFLAEQTKFMRTGMESPEAEEAHRELIADQESGKQADDLLKDDPILKQKIELKECGYAGVLKAIHEKTALSVIADSYRENDTAAANGVLVDGEAEIRHFIDGLKGNGLDKLAFRAGDWLVVQDKLWYEKRAADISQDYLNKLQEKINKNGLSIHTYEQAALDLSDPQLLQNTDMEKLLGFGLQSAFATKEAREGFRFFGSLKPTQVTLMTGKTRLAADQISAEALQHALAATRKALEDVQGKGAYFTGHAISNKGEGSLTSRKVILEIPKEDGPAESLTIQDSVDLPEKS